MAEWRKVTHNVHETGTADREDDVYEFGAEIDGVFVPAITKSAGYIEHLLGTRRAQQDAEDASTSGGGGGTESTAKS